MEHKGNPIGLIIWCIVCNVLHLETVMGGIMAISWEQAYFSNREVNSMHFTESASILGLFVVGAMIPSVVTMTTGTEF